VQRLEVLLLEREGTPQAGRFVRSIQCGLDPKRVDEGVTYFRDTITPQLRRQSGFRAAIVAVDRQQGRGVITTVWETQADEQATLESLADLRKQGLERFGATNPQIESLESVYVEFAATALTGR